MGKRLLFRNSGFWSGVPIFLAKQVAKIVQFGYNNGTEKGVVLCQSQQPN